MVLENVTSLIVTSGDRPLTDALTLMSDEGLTSVAVVDNASNVIGNISTADVKLLTKTSSLPLLQSSCIHFISVILTERGTVEGKDSFPGMDILALSRNFTTNLCSFPRRSTIYSRSHSCEVGSNQISPNVGC